VSRTFLDGLTQRNVLAVMDEEGVLLVMNDDVFYGGEGQNPHHVLAVGRRVDVEVLTAAGREWKEKNKEVKLQGMS